MDITNITALKKHCEALFNDAERDKGTWAHVVEKVFPEIVDSAYLQENYGEKPKRICSAARTQALTLASTMMTYVFPQGHAWFKFGSPFVAGDKGEQDDDYWFGEQTDVARAAIERSNFYPEMHGAVIDRVVTGTGLLLIEGDDNERMLYFTHVPSGTYAIAEDSRHQVNTVVRKLKYTLAQLEEEFGFENLSPTMQSDLRGGADSQSLDSSREIWHIVLPRDLTIKSFDGLAGEARPWASIYLDPQDDHVLSEDGMYEFPYMCTRFLRYGSKLYGSSPLTNVADTIKDLMVDEECLTMMNQRAAMPALAVPAEIVDQVTLEAGGIMEMPMQYIGMQVPREVAPVNSQGLQFLQAGMMTKKQEIADALYTSIFQNVSMQDRQMSATEVNAREAEKATNYYPTFTQLQVDMRTFCNRVFALLVRSGEISIDNAPQGVVQQYPDPKGVVREYIVNPKLVFIGKMSQAMERIQNSSMENFMAIAFQMFSALQNAELPAQFDWPYIIRKMASNAIPDQKCLLPKADADAKVQQVQQALMAQQQGIAEESAANADAKRAQAENARAQYA